MLPAMDRVTKKVDHLCRIAAGVALVLAGVGCSRFNSQRPSPPMLGRVTDTTDIYAMSRRSEPSSAIASSRSTGSGIASSTAPQTALVDEVAAALKPAESTPEPHVKVVELLAPTAIESRPSRAVGGVPNASLALASVQPRAVTRPAELIGQARTALDAMASYETSLHRQERVNGVLLPEEDVLLAIRRNPRAVRLTWPSGPNQGREVIYRADEPGGAMHVKMANPALPRLTMPPESPLVMRNSRHPVTEAGFESIVEGLEHSLKAAAPSEVSYAGLETVEGLQNPQHCLIRTTARGENWRIYLDPNSGLPSLVEAMDSQGRVLERYLFRDVRSNLPELALSNAFDPLARWGPPRGLFGRMARGESEESTPTPR